MVGCCFVYVCVCVCVREILCVCGGGGGRKVGGRRVHAAVRACVHLLLLRIFLVFERFLFPCFIESLMFYC